MQLRLSASLAFAFLVALVPSVRAEGRHVRVDARVGMYADDDATTVVTPRTRLWFAPDLDTEMWASYAVDFISSASVDVVSAATARITERRQEGVASISHTFRQTTLTGFASVSRERDFASQGFGLTVRQELARRSTAVEVGLSLLFATVGQGPTPLSDFGLHQGNFDARLTLSQVFSPVIEGGLTYEIQRVEGYQASPYRFVDVLPPGASLPSQRIPERVPDLRLRHALAATLAWSIAPWMALHSIVRGYADSWGLRALTTDLTLRAGPWHRLEGALRLRGHLQGGADFYRPRYEAVRRSMTVDRKLAPMWDALAGLELGWSTGPEYETPWFRALAHVDGWWFRWSDHPRMTGRRSVLVGAELELSF